MAMRVYTWLRNLLLRRRLDREMREELSSHIAQSTARMMARGLSREEAARSARREFGSMDVVQEQARDARGSRWLETAAADVRYAIRQFRRRPLATVTMVLVLALGIGANTGLFTFLHSLSTMPPPGIERDESLVRIQTIGRHRMSYREVRDYAAQDRYFDAVVAWTPHPGSMDPRGATPGLVPVDIVYTTPGYFEQLGVRPVLGSMGALSDERLAGTPPAVISHEMWVGLFGGSPDVAGRTIRVNESAVTIVGVAPPGFRGTESMRTDRALWLPFSARRLLEPGSGGLEQYDSAFFRAFARLKPGVSMAEAQPAVRAVAERALEQMRISRTRTGSRFERTARLAPLLADNAEASDYGDRQKALEALILGSMTLLVLLITCTNVSGLLVGAGMARRREIAVRLSLGAGRRRIIRQLLTESVILAVAAALFGLSVLWILIRVFGRYVPDVQLAIAWPVVAFAVVFAIATGVVFGLSPALHATRLSVGEVLKDAGPGVSHSRMSLQRGLIVAQVALTQPLLAVVALMIMGLIASMNYRAGSPFADRIVTLSFSSVNFQARTPEASLQMRAQFDAQLERIRAHLETQPGVVAAVRQVTYGIGLGSRHQVHPADRAPGGIGDEPFRLKGEPAGPGYFRMMGIPIVRGRDFDALDPERDSAAVLIGTDLAHRLFGDANPVGRRLVGGEVTAEGANPAYARNVAIVGVFDSDAAGASDTGSGYRVFTSLAAAGPGSSAIRLRTAGPAANMIPQLRSAASGIAPNVPISDVRTLASELADRRRESMLGTGIAGAAGLLALFLSAIGLYALVSLAVTQRTREIGIRTALGANRGDVLVMFFASALELAAIGIAIGLPLCLVGIRVFRFQLDLPNVRVWPAGIAVAAGVIAVASLAAWIPARRAAAVDPLSALRESVAGEAA